MKTKTKTFKEGEDIQEAMLFSQKFIWDNNVIPLGEREDDQWILKHKVKINIIIFDE